MHSDEHFEERRDAFAYMAIVASAVWVVAAPVGLGALLVWLFAS